MILKINQNLCLAYLFVVLAVTPLYKYFEYVLNFPRINITAIYAGIFLGTLLANLYFHNTSFKKGTSDLVYLLAISSGGNSGYYGT